MIIKISHNIKKPFRNYILAAFLSVFVLPLISSCGTPPNTDLTLSAEETDESHIAKLYFLRPLPLKFKGIADNPLKIQINGEYLLEIAEGEYHMARVQPMKAKISTHSLTILTNNKHPSPITRTRAFDLIAGKTYFIHVKRVNEEFRGIYYVPEPINLHQAQLLADDLRPRREARSELIKDIVAVEETPPPQPLEPALPEQVFPGEPYLIEGNPDYSPPETPEGKNEITFDEEPEEKIKRKFE